MSISEVRQTVKTGAKELGRQVAEGAAESVKLAGEKKQLLDMERDIRLGRIGAELERREEVRELKRTVSRETRETKSSL